MSDELPPTPECLPARKLSTPKNYQFESFNKDMFSMDERNLESQN